MADNEEGSNAYYNRLFDYQPRTKAKGEHVRSDLTAIENAFSQLPPHNNQGTGFDSSFEVANPVGPYSPVPLHYFRIWPEDVNANGHKLTGLGTATIDDKDHAANVEYVHGAISDALNPNVHPGDSVAWTYIAEGGETVIEAPYYFYTAAVYINGVYQDPYSVYRLVDEDSLDSQEYTINNLTVKKYIQLLDDHLMPGDEMIVLLGMNAPATADTLVYKQPMSVCVNYATPVDGEYVYCNMKMPVESHFPANLPDSSAISATAPKNIYVINIYKNDVLVGFVSWQPEETEGSFSFQNNVIFMPGDVLKIQSQIAPEDQISGIGLVLHGWRKVATVPGE